MYFEAMDLVEIEYYLHLHIFDLLSFCKIVSKKIVFSQLSPTVQNEIINMMKIYAPIILTGNPDIGISYYINFYMDNIPPDIS